jgi:hypothetical protein
VEAGADPDPGQRPLALESLADQAQDRQLALGPLDSPDALGGKGGIRDPPISATPVSAPIAPDASTPGPLRLKDMISLSPRLSSVCRLQPVCQLRATGERKGQTRPYREGEVEPLQPVRRSCFNPKRDSCAAQQFLARSKYWVESCGGLPHPVLRQPHLGGPS